MAAQFTTTKGPPARALAAWMEWAKSSLPVPDSPVSTTGRALRVPTLARSIALRSGSDRPRMEPNSYREVGAVSWEDLARRGAAAARRSRAPTGSPSRQTAAA